MHLTITNKTKPSLHQNSLFRHPLSKVARQSYLGVKLDSKLSWEKHVAEMTTKVLVIVKRTLARPMQTKHLTMLIRPKCEYAAPIWNPHPSSQINYPEIIQHCVARFVANDHKRKASSTILVLTLKRQTLERRRII